MRPRRILPISARSVSVAREMNGKSAKLRARRMGLRMTMWDSGPEARSHSPLVLASSWRFRFAKSIQTNDEFSNDRMTNGRVMWHSSFDICRSSFLILVSSLFDAANFVAQFGGLFVFFRSDG